MNINPDNVEQIPHTCLVRAMSIYGTLKSAEKKAMDFVLQNPREIVGASIVAIASKAGCSEATLVRLAKKLGYEGFPDLKSAFAECDNSKPTVLYREIGRDDDELTVVEKVFAAAQQSLRDTLAVLDKNEYSRAVQSLLDAGRIVFCGLGDAVQVALAAHHKFLRINVDTQAAEDPDLQLIMASHLRKGDVLVVISHSGRSKTVMRVARTARGKGAVVIAVTNYPRSSLAKLADIVLATADFAEDHNGEVVSKRVSELCVLESLYISYLVRKGEQTSAALATANEAVEIYKV